MKAETANEAEPEMPELSPEEIERLEEAEYLSELNNFHWVIYPFWKTIETICDKVIGCKSRAKQKKDEHW
eukprot:CAMPEP_0176353868 /NCGR_PEP_ID=MMETSP0126-20121128/12117_1 /TAXON_ID=141414 ORGANISM="Strombidinopsis acuminatum, Strain SPMC142" /NCGR_SAMPLE_ID=MMETSP0126 /ASSEMBLY_ACC=CAM_ASM_000229 /LENGTH=69 /DNA_ID=CAMNT_0017705733 /DNA_START=718 /DNA_END=924 /DNA_ORIENTATION=+